MKGRMRLWAARPGRTPCLGPRHGFFASPQPETALQKAGHEALHTLDLPGGNRTPDNAISLPADQECYIVVSKDSDFVVSLLLQESPKKLPQISTVNITNPKLEALFSAILGRFKKPSARDRMWKSTARP
jgi:predicted nuclease of predicted toxin-antitoxin system